MVCQRLILLSDTDQPFSPLLLSHLPEQPFPLAHTLRDGFFLGRTTDPDLDLSSLEIRCADGREGFDGEFDDGRTVEWGRARLSFPAFFQLEREGTWKRSLSATSRLVDKQA